MVLTLFEKGLSLTEQSAQELISTLQRNAMSLAKSSKFAKFVIGLCKSTQYQPMVSRFQAELSEIASQHKSILKSAMAREIRKLASCQT